MVHDGVMMSALGAFAAAQNGSKHNETNFNWQDLFENQRDRATQLTLSVALGLSAFLSFCVLRPRWAELYNARKKQSLAASRLPDLPKSMFGWIPVVYRISQAEVLASAGFDAYVFLSFFHFAIKYLCITLFFSLTIILPVNERFTGQNPFSSNSSLTNDDPIYFRVELQGEDKEKEPHHKADSKHYLWMYAAFTYFFTAIALYLLVAETKRIIRIRQAYLGTQSTVTDKTIRLSGVPKELQSEERIQKFIEGLGIGDVENVTLCRNWRKLDDTVAERGQCLRNLEASWAKYLGNSRTQRHTKPRSLRRDNESLSGAENTALLSHEELEQEQAVLEDRQRPMHTIRHGLLGFLNFRPERVDAIDYYEEHLRRLDDLIVSLRKEEFEPTALAFVTLRSTAACQMAVQAILNPVPGELIASLAPAPADVVWSNTYLTRNERMVRSWSIMILVGLLTILWAALLFPLASLLSISAIDEVFPGLADVLEQHQILRSLVRTGLPTLAISLLAIAVPYLYDWLSNKQGMTSQGDVEDSIISKNFFFTFFNLFIVFTIWGSAASFFEIWDKLKEVLKDATLIAHFIADSVTQLVPFYTNLIILQGIGLLPFRLLEFGSVALYPFYLFSARTPRDHAELSKAPVFSYGFYLPQTMLIFIMCIVYSVLPSSWLIILFGLLYFVIGGFIYKFQLLYAMEHRENSTGRAWPMICNRIVLGLVIFHAAMGGFLLLQKAFTPAVSVLPLLIGTFWYTSHFRRTYFPLMRFIALKSIDDRNAPDVTPATGVETLESIPHHGNQSEQNSDESQMRYINPSLELPLESVWIRRPGHHPGPHDASALTSSV